MTKALCWMPYSMILLLAACGGGGGGGGGGGSEPLPSIQITAPVNGQTITGSRSTTVSGTGANIGSVEVRVNGAAIPAADVSSSASGFTARVTLGDDANTIEAVASNSSGSASSGVVTVTYPFARFTSFQPAAVVIGQANFAARNPNPASATTLRFPSGNPLLSAGKLYVGDYGNNRVLVFDPVPTTNGAEADLVLGQRDFLLTNAGATAKEWQSPQTVVADESGRLLVVEYYNHRVLVLDGAPTASTPAADRVVGQPSIASTTSGCTQNRLNYPTSIFTVGGKLLVADSGNNRVLVWNSIPTADGAPADLVLGQTSFTSRAANAGSTTVNASGLDNPTDVWSDGTRLVVVDQYNNRVLVWNTFPTANGAPADVAVGQPDLATNTRDDLQGKLDSPSYVSSNGNQLAVADVENHRVMIWNTFPTSSGALADVVLGQGDFGRRGYNDDDQDGASDTAPTARTLNYPSGVMLRDHRLFVVDSGNSRLLVYEAQAR